MVKIAIVAVVLASCGYSANYEDCTIACSTGTCPSDFTCSAGVCRAAGATASCDSIRDAAPAPDGNASSDAHADGGAVDGPASDAGQTDITLSENTGSDISGGETCPNPVGNFHPSYRYEWYRVFRPSDGGATGAFHITTIHLASTESSGSTVITVSAWLYTGAFGAAVLDTTKMTTQLGTTVMPAIPNGGVQTDPVPFVADVPPGSLFVIHVSGHDQYNVSTMNKVSSFHLAASTGGETAPAYFWSDCSFGQSQTQVQESSHDYLISVTGRYTP